MSIQNISGVSQSANTIVKTVKKYGPVVVAAAVATIATYYFTSADQRNLSSSPEAPSLVGRNVEVASTIPSADASNSSASSFETTLEKTSETVERLGNHIFEMKNNSRENGDVYEARLHAYQATFEMYKDQAKILEKHISGIKNNLPKNDGDLFEEVNQSINDLQKNIK